MKDDRQIDELDRILSEYYAKRIDDDLDKFVADGVITPKTIENWDEEHIVSNDNHLNVLKTIPFPKVSVLTIKEFMKKLE